MLTAGPTAHEESIVGEHFQYLKRLAASGVVLMAGRTLNNDERTFGMIVFSASSKKEAAEIMRNDPAVRHGVMRAELFPYRVALWSPKGPGDNETEANQSPDPTPASVTPAAGPPPRQP